MKQNNMLNNFKTEPEREPVRPQMSEGKQNVHALNFFVPNRIVWEEFVTREVDEDSYIKIYDETKKIHVLENKINTEVNKLIKTIEQITTIAIIISIYYS